MIKYIILFLLLITPVLAETNESAFDEVVNEKLEFAQILLTILGVVLVGVLLAKKGSITSKMGYSIAIILLLFIGYSYYVFTLTASEEEGITVCAKDECFWAAHIHADLFINICGENIDLGLEKGPLDSVHTHKEKNRLHFHERLTVDPETREVSDYGPLRLESFLNELDLSGDCGELTMTVNDNLTEMANFAYKEGVVIRIER